MSADTALSSAQQRLWFLWQLRPDGNEYNVPRATRLRGALDSDALRRALDLLVARHDALRATFPTVAGAPVLRIAAEAEVPLPLTDLSALPTAERDAALDEAVTRAALAPFDLAHGPVLRAELIRLAEDDHALVLTFHHIAVDGWSMGIIDRDLAALYAATVAGDDAPSAAPARSYRDCVAAEQRLLAGPRRHEALDHWRTELAGAPLELALPTDRPHPTAPSFAGDSRGFPVPPELAERLDAVAVRHRVTRFIALLSGYAALLSRMTSTPDLVIGVPVSGRTEMEVEGTVGLFVNMMPVRIRCTADTTFGALLHQVRDTVLAGHEYQDLPFQLLVEEVQPDRSTARHPLFQTVVTYEDLPTEGTALPGLDASPLPIPTRTAKYELALHLAGNRQRTEAWVGYQTDVFDDRSAELIGDRYLRLLSAALDDPDTPVAQLPVLGSEEERLLLTDWAGAPERAAPCPARERVDQLVERQARAHPDAVAVRSDEGALSYAALDRAADRIAAGLRAAGAGPGTVVATCLPRGADLVTAQLGVLKSGAAYLSLDPAHPAPRLTALLAEARPLLTLTGPEHRAGLEYGRVETLHSLRDAGDAPDAPDVPDAPDGPPAASAGPDDLAYVMYTSGSTGRPKGVLVEHHALANLVAWHRAEFGIGPGDRCTLVAAPGFDASVWETWSALTAGATVEVPSAETVLSPSELRSWLIERGITSAFLPTPLLERMLQEPWPAASALRSVLTGGDRLHGTGRNPLPFRLVNNYGPTENTVVATSGTVPADGGERDTLPGIGRPVTGTEAYVLDAELRPVPVGVPGELYLGGEGLARGYLGQPALTADRFVPHPFSRTPGARLYRTGDLVRWRTDAGLDFLGRNDHQVKIRGIRVEPGEIENVLRAHPGVHDAVVAAGSPDGTAEPELTAYLVPADASGAPDLAALLDHTTRRLPRHMHPRRYLLLPSVPLTANGKVDRTALAGAARELAPPPAAAHRRARTPLERLISDVWALTLGHDSFGTDDNFFDAGGHSLLLASVRDRLTAELGTPVRIADLYAYPTIATLARQLSGSPGSTAEERPAGRTGGDGVAERRRRGAARLTAMRARTSHGRAERQ
ncbi:non-ribosomal peptide synthetase [Streptomyces catenulae]|uniref:Non-ribosomal peptide synthetase n=1 Tax=Streptomyces catenulae TaxID=66875 RepID=A0ABV2Z1Z4_9ACTN|nr:non-ribosomal peptide synthetase [Streptomyces catenulae]